MRHFIKRYLSVTKNIVEETWQIREKSIQRKLRLEIKVPNKMNNKIETETWELKEYNIKNIMCDKKP